MCVYLYNKHILIYGIMFQQTKLNININKLCFPAKTTRRRNIKEHLTWSKLHIICLLKC